MKTDAIDLDTLPDDPKVLKALMGKMMQRMNWLEEQFRLAQHQRFGANGEAHPGQGELFNEAEDIHATQGVESDIDTESETTTVIYERLQAKRRPLPAELPRERIVHDIAEANKVCACCDSSCIASAKMSRRNLRLSLHKSKLSSMYALSMREKRVKQAGQRIRINKRRCQIRLSPKAMRHRAY